MAVEEIWVDLDGKKVGVLKDWRNNPLTTLQRISLGGGLDATHTGLSVFDADLNKQFFWDGAVWIAETGVPAGGSAGQVLKKNSATDFDMSWQNDSSGVDEEFVIAMAITL